MEPHRSSVKLALPMFGMVPFTNLDTASSQYYKCGASDVTKSASNTPWKLEEVTFFSQKSDISPHGPSAPQLHESHIKNPKELFSSGLR